MFKVIKFELRKLVSRPGIYVLAVLLALLLTVSAFAYNPIENKKTYNTLSGSTISEIDADFNENYKSLYDDMVTSTEELANSMLTKTAEDYQTEIIALLTNVKEDIDIFIDSSVDLSSLDNKLSKLKAIHNSEKTGSLDILNETISTIVGKENNYIAVASTQSNYSTLIKNITELKENIENILDLGSPNNDDFKSVADKCASYKSKLEDSINNFKYVDYTDIANEFVVGSNYYKITIERHNVIERKMDAILTKVAENSRLEDSKDLKKEFNNLFNEYRLVSENYTTLFNVSKNLKVMNSFAESDMSNIKFVDKESQYSLRETKTKYTYFMEKDSNELNYANALSFDYSSNDNANGFDYSYFALSIFSVVLIIFAIMLGAFSIAGETKDGTMRFISIRPISRTTLYWGKFFSIAIISLIMLIFASIASIIVGSAVFGIDTLNILTIINATKVIVIHPSLALIILIGSIFLTLLVFTSIAMMFSSFLKSDLLALILTAGIYVINMLLPLFFNSTSWLRFNPFANINLYAYVGAGTMTADSILGKIFTSVVYHGINIWVSIIFIVLIVGITNMIGIHSTKKREF